MATIEDTFCEAFSGLVVQLMVTAQDAEFLTRAINAFTALPSTLHNMYPQFPIFTLLIYTINDNIITFIMVFNLIFRNKV